MSTCLARVLLAVSMAIGAALPVRAGDPAPELHGMADAYAGSGVALAWGILRGGNEAQTLVVLRIVTNPAEFPAMTATGTDPFTQRTVALPIATPTFLPLSPSIDSMLRPRSPR